MLYRHFESFQLFEGVIVRSTKSLVAVFALISATPALALPIDWGGSLGFDTNLINNIRRTKDSITKPDPKDGTQGIEGGDNGAHFQTYIFKLNPHMIVNDAVSIKGELSSGHLRGGFFGGDSTQTQDSTTGSNAYHSTVPAQRSALNVNQLYAELYADTALIKVGRFAKEFGSGAVLHAGRGTFDRFFTQYDGIQGEMRIGNFSLTPHWAKLGSYDAINSQDTPNGSRDVREMGLIASYDNKSTDTTLAIAYTKRFSEGDSTLYPQGRTNVTLLNAYFAKNWEKVKLTVDVPTLTGEYGNVYFNDGAGVSATSQKARIASSAALVHVTWLPSQRWDLGTHFGQVGGDKGSTQKFEGMQLNPNYHIAELMFRYNYTAFNEGSQSIFDSGITNARFYKLYANYKTDKWTWTGAVIMATALETAKKGKNAYHHEERYRFGATRNQASDYGTEVDLAFAYQWNPNVNISGYLGYWLVGDYYKFSNAAKEISTQNVLGSGLRLGITF